MEAAIVAGLAGLLGLALGRLWDRRSELGRWRRDQRLRCYENLASTYYRMRDLIRLLSAAAPGTDASEIAANRVQEVGADWQRDVVAVWLHGSEPVTAAVKELDDRLNEAFLTARARRFTWDEWRIKRLDAEEALERVIATIRREFSLPEFPIVLRWRPEESTSATSTGEAQHELSQE